MIDYEKVQQAHELLAQSGVPFVAAYQNQSKENTISSVVGTELNTVNNIRGIVKNFAKYCTKTHRKEELLGVLFEEIEQVVEEAYSDGAEQENVMQ